MAFTGDIGDTAPHSHAAVQVLLVTHGRVTLIDAAGRSAPAHSAIIPPGVRHEVHADPGTTGLLAYLDPAGAPGQAAVARVDDRTADSTIAWIAAATPVPGTAPRPAPGVYPSPRQRLSHPAVAAALRWAAESPNGPPALVELADQVAMSPSRLSHLFAAEIGLPYAAWRRWARLQRAIDEVRAGASLTRAAHAAGFADSAHLTRTCRDLFGITPTDALLAAGWRSTPA
ncbi:helix-turn-helix transcriptional regulator [Nocardia ninae]|nr:AraC family transcriptional regulator [Nocardia ninae]